MAAVAQLSSQSGEKGSRFDPFACRRAAEKPYELPASASATSSGASAASGAEPSASHESLAALLTGERPDASLVRWMLVSAGPRTRSVLPESGPNVSTGADVSSRAGAEELAAGALARA